MKPEPNNKRPSRCLARLVLALRRWRRKHIRTTSEIAEDMCRDFAKTFPCKCIICSYHRFGRDHGMTTEPLPAPHDCIDCQTPKSAATGSQGDDHE